MIKKYSIGKIFQYEFRMYYDYRTIIGNIILLLYFTISYFTANYKARYVWLYFDLFLIIIAVLIMLKSIFKINRYFKKGIIVSGEIIKREDFLLVSSLRSLPVYKFTVISNYYIDDQIYRSSNTFIDRNDISYLKEGTKLRLLVNKKNKNDAIIMDLYAEDNDGKKL